MSFPPLRAWLFVCFNSLLLLSLGFFIGGRVGLFIALILAVIWNYLLTLHRHPPAFERFHAKHLRGRDPWLLHEVLLKYGEKFRTPKVEIYLCDNRHPLFMVSTADWKKPALLLSETLLDLLNPGEREAMLALALSTIKFRQSSMRYVFERLALNWITLGQIIEQLLPFRHLHLISRTTYLIAWFHLKVAFPASLQTKADAEASQTINNPRDLASALWKITGHLEVCPPDLPSELTHQSLLSLPHSSRGAFQFTVPIENRLRLLVGYYPI